MKQLELEFQDAYAPLREVAVASSLEEAVQYESVPTEQPPRRYHVPGMTENPCVTYGMVRRWIMDFHQMNEMKLPSGFYQRNKKQLVGMFYGMLGTYGISLEEIVGRESGF
ncbi:MAG: hypothetical protein Q8R53_03445 [Nanoarchaeota archaeon]|nr:hypothetical protein [Nanoarchaeota archaeon]